MSSPESGSKDVAEDENEEQIYRFIYGMDTTYEEEEKEWVQTPPSSGPTPVHLEMSAERVDSEDKMTHKTTQAQVQKDQEGSNTKGTDMDMLDNTQDIPVLKANAKEKPWRKPGADISDYFNYDFDEESWNTYCKKQSKLRAANRKLYAKKMVQMGSCSAHPSSCSPSIIASSRQSSAAIDVTEGRPGPSGRGKGGRCFSDEGNNSQMDAEMSPEEERITSYHLSPPSKVISLFEVTAPPPFLYRRPFLSPRATSDSGQPKGCDDPSTSLYPSSTGVPSLLPRTMSSRAGVVNTAKAWECYIQQEKCEREYRDRPRERGHDKDRKRSRDRNKESCTFSSSRGKERMKHRDTAQRGHKHHSLERFTGEKEERYRDREGRHRDKNDWAQKPSCSSSRRDSGEHRGRQRRHNQKKAKKRRQDKETNKMSCADQEKKLKSD